MRLETMNDAAHGLGIALPAGGLTLFEPTSAGELLVGEESLQDRAAGQQVGVALANSTQVFLICRQVGSRRDIQDMTATISNAGHVPVRVRLELYTPSLGQVTGLRNIQLQGNATITELTVPAGRCRRLDWSVRQAWQRE